MIQKHNTYYVENEKLYFYTSAGIKTEIPAAAYGNLLEKIEAIGNPLSYSGAISVNNINSLSNIKTGTVYTITGTSGVITAGDISANSGDEVTYSTEWFKIGSDIQAGIYSAGPNIDVTDFVISGRDWSPELSAKQDVLSAGSGIDITNNTISVNSDVITTADIDPSAVQNALDTLNAAIAAMNNSYTATAINRFVSAVYQTDGVVSASFGDIISIEKSEIENLSW